MTSYHGKKRFSLFFKRNASHFENGKGAPIANDAVNGNFKIIQTGSSIPAAPPRPKSLPAGGIHDLVKCPLCLNTLNIPKMLPCQHTFCMTCLQKIIPQPSGEFCCPSCQYLMNVPGRLYIDSLPTNVYIESLLNLLGPSTRVAASPEYEKEPKADPATEHCYKCGSLVETKCISNCQHCKRVFCAICWSQHLDDLKIQAADIEKQLDSAENRLAYKLEGLKDRYERLVAQINSKAEARIDVINKEKYVLLQEAESILQQGNHSVSHMTTNLNDARISVKKSVEDGTWDDFKKVSNFMEFHKNSLSIINDVNKWDELRFTFDDEKFRIDRGTDRIEIDDVDSDEIDDHTEYKLTKMPQSQSDMQHYYKSKKFIPHLLWKKSVRPGGVGIDPWEGHMYVCDMDARVVLVVERNSTKIIDRITCPEMLYPVHIAFMASLKEFYVTDKWKNCVHVFTKEGEFIRSLGTKGNKLGQFRSPEGIATDDVSQYIYVVDSGNDRVLILQSDGSVVGQLGVGIKSQPHGTDGSVWSNINVKCTEFNCPTSIAITEDRIVVLDTGNRRVKVYDKDYKKLLEFGSMGSRRGQFKQPEAVAVDTLGFILVGDSGNARIQVFNPAGNLVRVFGGYGAEIGKYSWISGIYVTTDLCFIICDSKNHNISII